MADATIQDIHDSSTNRSAIVKGPAQSSDEYFLQTVDRSVMAAVLRAAGPTRRQFLVGMGASALTALIAEVFPLGRLKAFAADPVGKPEKKDVTIGFIPITCGTPIIMAEPLGFYAKHGLNANVKRAAGWAMIRDWAVNGDTDASHFLSPMPLAFTLGAGSLPVPFYMPAVENINGQAITLHMKHKGVKTAADMKGFRFCVPFDFSMHNYLLRYFLAEGGIHPDKDVQIRIVPPPEMVANLKAGNVDGYLGQTRLTSAPCTRTPGSSISCRRRFGIATPAAPLRSPRSLPRSIPTRSGRCGGRSWMRRTTRPIRRIERKLPLPSRQPTT